MTDQSKRLSYENAGYITGKMVNDLSPRKTMIVLVIVVGCFAILWPKVFYPMLMGSANNKIKPSSIDRTQGCCDVLYEKDVTTIKLMSEICSTIIRKDDDSLMSNRELIQKCQNVVLDTCGIDISAVLQEQVRLGHTTRQILQEIRSLNGSLCLKYNFGVATWKLGVPHRITVKMSPSFSIRQERPLHLRSEMVHPAFRERGRAIPQAEFAPTKPAPPSRLIPKVIDGRPGPVPGMRPTIGGAGHVVPAPKQGGTSMGLIMPIYTIGIVIFFTYTVMKIVFKKQTEVLYPPINPDPHFRREVFEADRGHLGSKTSKDKPSSKLVVNAMSALLDEVDMELSSRRKPSEVIQEEVFVNGSLINQEDDQSSVQVLGMETTASRENGQRWARYGSTGLPVAHPHASETPPQEIFLEGSLPPQSHLLVTDSATEAQKVDTEEDPSVVLAGKMTLSVISLDSSENGTDESSNSGKKHEDRSSSNVSEEFEKIDVTQLEEEINNIIAEADNANLDDFQNIEKESEKSEEFIAHEAEACTLQVATTVIDSKPVIPLEESTELVNLEEDKHIEADTTLETDQQSVKSDHLADDMLKQEISLIKDEEKNIDTALVKTEIESMQSENLAENKLKEDVSLVHGEIADNAKTKDAEEPNTALIENLIKESVNAVVETIQDKQKELDTLLLKTEEELAQTAEFFDTKIDQIQKDIAQIEKEQKVVKIEEIGAAKAEPKEEVQVKEIIDNAEESVLSDIKEFGQNKEREIANVEESIDNIKVELIVPAVKIESDKNKVQEILNVQELSATDMETSASELTQNKAPSKEIIDNFEEELTTSGIKKESNEDKETKIANIQELIKTSTEDVIQKESVEATTESISSPFTESSSKELIQKENSDIKNQEKEKTDIIDKAKEVILEKVGGQVELEAEEYALECDNEEDEEDEDEIDNDERIEKIETTGSRLKGAVLLDKENSENQHEENEEQSEEDEEEYDEESEDDEDAGEIDPDIIEYISDEEEEEVEVEEEEEEEDVDGTEEDLKVISHV